MLSDILTGILTSKQIILIINNRYTYTLYKVLHAYMLI